MAQLEIASEGTGEGVSGSRVMVLVSFWSAVIFGVSRVGTWLT